jgi:steroid delta-isomerase-like uncharacterized protein
MKTLMQIFKILNLVVGVFIISKGFAQKDHSDLERNKEVVKKYFEVVVNERKIDLLDELFHQDRVYIDWNSGEREGDIDELKTFLIYFFNAFPDIFSSVEEIIAEDNKVMVKINFRGTHLGEFWGFSPSGNSINVNEAFIYYLRDGKIFSSTRVIDMKVLESQLKKQQQ